MSESGAYCVFKEKEVKVKNLSEVKKGDSFVDEILCC